tara:strand:+ start:1013 stop:1750 length:738 start_codon:yes stop_codon:yes gene_type:complete
MKEQKITFKNSKGEKIVGLLSNAKSDTIVILCHGHWSSKEGTSVAILTKLLNKEGIGTFRLDFSGGGESEGKIEDLTISKETDEILQAIKLFKKDFKKIVVYGSSYGGGGAILSAIKSKDINLLMLKAPIFDWIEKKSRELGVEGVRKWKEDGYYQDSHGRKYDYALYKDAEKIQLTKSAQNIKIPVIIVQGDEDKAVLLSSSELFKEKVPQTNLEIIKGVGHRIRGKPLEKANNLFLKFLRENI